MEVTGIKRNDFLVLRCIANIEIVRTYRIAFQTDTEYLRFDTVLHVLVFSSEDLVERILQQSTVLHAVHGDVLATVVYPQVHDTRVALALTHFFGNGTTMLGMFNPEITDAFIRIGQGQVTRLRMRERSGIEVQLHVVFGCPLHPAFEVFRFYLITIHKLASKVTIDFMQVQTMITRNQRSRLQNVGTEFIDIASLARIVTGRLDTTGQFASRFKAGHIICLPAMQGKLDTLQLFQYFFYIYTDGRITFHSQFIRLSNVLFVHGLLF